MGAQARFSGQGEKGKKKRRNANISQSMVCSVSKYLVSKPKATEEYRIGRERFSS